MKTNLTSTRNLAAFVFGCLIFVTLGLTFSITTGQHTVAPSERVGVDFGRGPGCDGPRGLCSVSSGDDSRSHAYNDTSADFYLDKFNNLRMKIDKGDISVQDAETQFVNGLFKQEEYLQLPKGLINALGLPAAYSIEAGYYPIEETPAHYLINFTSDKNKR